MPDIVTGKIFVDGEKGITSTKMNQIISQSVIQPDFVTTKPSSSTLDPTDQLIEVKSTGAYARITGQQLSDSVAGSSSITAMRLRSFNAINNPTFEVDQRTAGGTTTTAGSFAVDRWLRGGSLGYSVQATGLPQVVPGTNFAISKGILRLTLTTQKTSLAATDLMYCAQTVEGPVLRELINDVHSVSILCRSSVASVAFSVSLRDSVSAYSLTQLCTTSPTPNTWTLITLPNLPIWTASGTFPLTPGSAGYTFVFCLAAGSTYISPANGTWQSGNFPGAVGMGNFAANAVNSTFDVAFVQHEPGALCTTPIDKPFTQNLDECLRYFQKSYLYATAPGAVSQVGQLIFLSPAISTTGLFLPIRFHKPMAKTPTVTAYSAATGASGTVRNNTTAADVTVSSIQTPGDTGFGGFVTSTAVAANSTMLAQFTADTGW